MTRRFVIVGNGPVRPGSGALIDAADRVMRFNAPAGKPEEIGTRTDSLVLINSGKAMQGWLRDDAFLSSPFLRSARRIVLPLHPSVIAAYHPNPNALSRLKGRRADWTAQAIDTFGRRGKEVTVLPGALYEEACIELGIGGEKKRGIFPSTGFLGILHALRTLSPADWRIEICGFGWQGWKRHDWEKERRWIEAGIDAGEVHPLAAARRSRSR